MQIRIVTKIESILPCYIPNLPTKSFFSESLFNFIRYLAICMPGVSLMVWVVGFGSQGPEFKSCSAVELIPGGVNSACHPSEVIKMSASMLVYCVGVVTRPGLCPTSNRSGSGSSPKSNHFGGVTYLGSQPNFV